MTLRELIHQARGRLMGAGIAPAEAALDAELLAREVLGWDRASFVARAHEVRPSGFLEAYETLLRRRARREPVAYILGRQEFWGRSFAVAPGVLIPRPETELLIEEALSWSRGRGGAAPPRIMDIGTGSGCLAVTLALEVPSANVHATDVSADALAIARDNASRLGAAVTFHTGSVLADVPAPIDLIVSNPPYVTRAEYAALQGEVREYEPVTALVGGDDGLEVVRQIVAAAAVALTPGGRLLMEIGHGQSGAVTQLVETSGLHLVVVRPDLQGIPRAVVAARGPDRPPTASE